MSNAFGAGAPGGQPDPSMIQRIMAYLGVGGAQAAPAPAMAASLQRGPSPLNNPSPVNLALAGGGPPVPSSLTSPPPGPPPIGGGPGMAMQGPTGPQSIPIGGGSGMAMQSPSMIPGGGSSGGAGASGSIQMGPEGPAAPPVNIPIGGGPGMAMDPKGYTGTPAPVVPVRPRTIGRGGGRASSAASSPSMQRGPGSVASGSPFTQINRPNMGPAPMYDQQGNPVGPMTGGALARGGGPPLMTALDLSSLFGRR
jgi:hypothetical protein